MTSPNPIAALLNLPAGAETFQANGQTFEYHAASAHTTEGVYRKNPGYAVGNPCFTLFFTRASHHAMALGQYLAGRDAKGVKRAEAERIVAAARLA